MWLSFLLTGLVRILVGASPRWIGCSPNQSQRIYFSNHSSHLDALAIWSALPYDLRCKTRPVAAADYWDKGIVRRYIALKGLNAVFINRKRDEQHADPLTPLMAALNQGDSLIIFPEGTRNRQALPAPFKSGLFHLASQFRNVELVPVYLENLHRSMPKGTILPIPLICTVRFGTPLYLSENESKNEFLERSRKAVSELA